MSLFSFPIRQTYGEQAIIKAPRNIERDHPMVTWLNSNLVSGQLISNLFQKGLYACWEIISYDRA